MTEQHETDPVKIAIEPCRLRREIHERMMQIHFMIIVAMIIIAVTMVYSGLAFIWLNQHRASKYQQYQSPPPAQTQTVQTISE